MNWDYWRCVACDHVGRWHKSYGTGRCTWPGCDCKKLKNEPEDWGQVLMGIGAWTVFGLAVVAVVLLAQTLAD